MWIPSLAVCLTGMIVQSAVEVPTYVDVRVDIPIVHLRTNTALLCPASCVADCDAVGPGWIAAVLIACVVSGATYCRQESVEGEAVLLFDCVPPIAELERKLNDLVR